LFGLTENRIRELAPLRNDDEWNGLLDRIKKAEGVLSIKDLIDLYRSNK
jgi:hypothetical protein